MPFPMENKDIGLHRTIIYFIALTNNSVIFKNYYKKYACHPLLGCKYLCSAFFENNMCAQVPLMFSLISYILLPFQIISRSV